MTTTMTLPGKTLPGILNPEITLKPLSSNTLLMNDATTSLHLSISGTDRLVISPANSSDQQDRIPPHLMAAGLDYLYANHPMLEQIHLSPLISERLEPESWLHDIDQTSGESINVRTGFYQNRTLWHWQNSNVLTPEIWTENSNGISHPLRPLQPSGVVYQRYDYQNDLTISFRSIDPEEDLAIFHQWMNQPRVAEFWEMAKSKEELRNYLQTLLKDRKTWPLVGSINGEPFGYFELYWAMEDRIAPYYDCQPWDRGFHLLVGNPDFLGKRFSNCWTKSITHFLYLDDPRTGRLVGEPRADNQRLLKLLAPAGWSFVKAFDFPHKRAALVNGYRRTFFREVQL
ncbi:GNAT family N-acetyltransferase [Endozoicomonas sp. YOMI1]|uniref:GNAT family N-acetyltransferase n=1 Tax=Endozoicomonas sp. YOMI1 TaxID=2828739 RepID=UPI00214863B1|nr:GNAT family N-acetyltransferase [Endozoicomonas sp. YOMI1]